MAQSLSKMKAQLMREYYKYFSKYAKGKEPENKVAWVTAFTPVEILEALNISYYYPESYAAVIAASGKEQLMLNECDRRNLSRDCCGYSCCIEGCLEIEEGPRGIPPKPDILIATNNQCNTLPNWWNILANRYNIPLIIIDYPGEYFNNKVSYKYVTEQHISLIKKMEELSGNKLNMNYLLELLSNSARSVMSWNKIMSCIKTKEARLTMFFDDITYLIINRCNPLTSELYEKMAEELNEKPDVLSNDIAAFWIGYPLWYHPSRYISEILDGIRITGANYLTWWSLDYTGKDVFEQLYNAYNFTFLNLNQETRNNILIKNIEESGARCAITLHNKSCKCDFVSSKNLKLPQIELEIDMIDRYFLDIEKAKIKIDLLKDIV